MQSNSPDGANTMLTQDQLKLAVARKALEFVPEDCIIGVGTGSTVNLFIQELATIKGRLKGAVSSSGGIYRPSEGPAHSGVRTERCGKAGGVYRWC
jgi:DeoR/GlpR family transcriptional regulator of sugar metabolism